MWVYRSYSICWWHRMLCSCICFHIKCDETRWWHMHWHQKTYLSTCLGYELVSHHGELYTWPRVHKAFQNKDQDQAQVKHSYIMDFFKTFYNYLTSDCWYLKVYAFLEHILEILPKLFQWNKAKHMILYHVS